MRSTKHGADQPRVALPSGTKYVTVAQAPALIAEALYPGSSDATDVLKLVQRTHAEDQHRDFLRKAIQTGKLVTYSLAMIPLARADGAMPTARILVKDFEKYLQQFGIAVAEERPKKQTEQASAGKTWKDEAVRLANEEALKLSGAGIQEITARGISQKVADRLAKDPTFDGNRGPRRANTIRTYALNGWKPPKDDGPVA